MNKYSLSALVAAGLLAGGLTAGSASAADLGGNCCADLEERIAELEATTARKGNRKVSLTVSGFVAQQILGWDDGEESNVYITDTGSVSIGSHFKFTGQATIAPGWSAGYVLKIEAIQNDSLLVDQNNDNGIANSASAVVGNNGSSSALSVESSYWFIKSENLGRLSVGKQSSAVDNQAILPDGSGTLVVANYIQYENNAFFLRNGNGTLSGLRFGGIADCLPLNGGGGTSADCDGYPNNNIRYDTPTYAGFSGSASWGEDDIWGVSLRYSGEFNGVKLAAAIAYNESSDENGPGALANGANGGADGDSFSAAAVQIGAYVEHVPTGLFVYGAYVTEYDNDNFVPAEPEGDNFYIKAGLRTRMNSLGHTIFYGEYGENSDKMSTENFVAGITDSNLRQYGVGVVQEVDAAAMSVWLAWRHYESDATCNGKTSTLNADGDVTDLGCTGGDSLNLATGNNDFEDFDVIKAGALINF